MEKSKFIAAYLNAKPLPLEDINEARRLETARSTRSARIPFSGHIDNVSAATLPETTRVRIYTPAGKGPFPAILYMHGGGFCIGSPATTDNLCRIIAKTANAILISVDYALAPEHKFPHALEECYRTALWMIDHDVALNIHSDQLSIAGDSAGGNLAAGICLLAAQRQDFHPLYQVLICPLLDLKTPHTFKIKGLKDSLLTTKNCQTFNNYYLQDRAEVDNPLVSPLLAEDLSGLPPTTIISAALDPLADEAISYAKRLQDTGVTVRHRHYAGQVHDFVLFVQSLDEAREAAENIGADLNKIISEQ